MKPESIDKQSLQIVKNYRQDGFSLIEMLAAMAIFLIITGAIYGLLQVGRVDRSRASHRADVLKNARIAIHLIGRDALNAGLSYNRTGAVAPEGFVSSTFGLPADPDTKRDAITSIMAGNDLFVNDLNPNPEILTDTALFCYRDMDFNEGDLVQLTDVFNSAGDSATARVQAVSPPNSPPGALTGAEQAQRHHLYLVESDSTQVAIMATGVNGSDLVDAAPGDPLGLNQPLDGEGELGSVLRRCGPDDPGPPIVSDQNCTTYVATLKRFIMIGYKVKPDGTLVRTVYGNNTEGTVPSDQIREQPLAYGVENFQISYVLEDGTVTNVPTAYSDGGDNVPSTGNEIPDQLNLIRQITVTITVQATGSDAPNQRPESITFTATFSARNIQYAAG